MFNNVHLDYYTYKCVLLVTLSHNSFIYHYLIGSTFLRQVNFYDVPTANEEFFKIIILSLPDCECTGSRRTRQTPENSC